jgi:TetR/AcrR family transcriptional regulator, mexJK operon transcriptional repressor
MLDDLSIGSGRAARKADRRRTILEVAERSFLEQGYANTSMSTIAAELGGSKTTLWTYFPSKEALFAAVLDSKIADFQARLDETLLPTGGPEATLKRFGTIFLQKIIAPQSIALKRLIMAEADRFPNVCCSFAERGPDRVRARLSRWMEDEMTAGRLRAGDPLLAARQFIGLCQAGCYFDLLWRPEQSCFENIDTEVAAATTTFMAAWGPRE